MSVAVGVDGGQSQIRLRVSGESQMETAPGFSYLESDTVTSVVDTVTDLWNSRGDHISRLVAGLTTLPDTANERRLLATRLAEATGASEAWPASPSTAIRGLTGLSTAPVTWLEMKEADFGWGDMEFALPGRA